MIRKRNIPFYGVLQGARSTPILDKADKDLIRDSVAHFGSRESAAKAGIDSAWKKIQAGDLAEAISTFNKVWLLDPTNGLLYHGMAVARLRQGAPADEVEELDKQAVVSRESQQGSFSDYPQFLTDRARPEEALAILDESANRFPEVRLT